MFLDSLVQNAFWNILIASFCFFLSRCHWDNKEKALLAMTVHFLKGASARQLEEIQQQNNLGDEAGLKCFGISILS